MRFDDIIKSLLVEDNNEIALICKDKLIKIGDTGLLKDIISDPLYDIDVEDYKRAYNPTVFETVWKPLLSGSWELQSIYSRDLRMPAESAREIYLPGVSEDVVERLSVNIIKEYKVRLIPVLTAETLSHPGRGGTYFLIYQTRDRDGEVVTWNISSAKSVIRTVGVIPNRTIFLDDVRVTTLKEYERETTIASHKDHNELVDLIDL